MSGLYLLDTNVVLALVRGKELGAFIDSTYGLSTAKRRPAVSVVNPGLLTVKYIDPTALPSSSGT